MKNYLGMASRHLSGHKKNTKLTIISVMIAVALVTTIFSMIDVFWTFEKQQTINDYGNYHILINNVTDHEAEAIANRIDVEQAVRYCQLENATLEGHAAVILTGDKNITDIFSTGQYNRYSILQGTYPEKEDEAVIEDWTAQRYGLQTGDSITVSLAGVNRQLRIAGICENLSSTQSEAVTGIFIPLKGEYRFRQNLEMQLFVRFKAHADIGRAEQNIKDTLGISTKQIQHNERLLALLGKSRNTTVWGMYATGTVLFLLVLVAGITMIYNTFNISVMDRIRQFGLLPCIGASRRQIRKLVYQEGKYIVLRAVPAGILIGVVFTWICSAVLKFYNSSFFTEISLFSFSVKGIFAGTLVGILTVWLALLSPAKKASRVSPVYAVSGGCSIPAPRKYGIHKGMGHMYTELALGIRNAVSKRKTFLLMSASIAISVILFLGFQVFVNFMYSSMRTVKPYTPDLSIVSEKGMDEALYAKIKDLKGVRRVYGRMFDHVEATFDASHLTDIYKKSVDGIITKEDGTFTGPEKAWLISYDRNQLKWAHTDLSTGTLSEDRLNEKNGIIAVALNNRRGISMETASLRVGDKVKIQTAAGPKEYTVMAVLRSVPFTDSSTNLVTFITTEKLYKEIVQDTKLDVIDIQLNRKDQEQTVSEIRKLVGNNVTFSDSRQKNAQATQAFLTMAVFTYGFVAVIALISILNIINTMQTSVSAKTKYIGMMRAVGMSRKQLYKMIFSEAAAYGISGCIVGVLGGVMLQKVLTVKVLSGAHLTWHFPTLQVIVIFSFILAVSVLAVISPLKKIQAMGISESIGSLQ